MIRLLRRVASLAAGTETDMFSAAEEAAFCMDGTAVLVEVEPAPAPDYAGMKKDDLLREAMSRGLDVSPRATKGEIIEALEMRDDA